MHDLISEERFWAKVEKTDTCWLWTASTDKLSGYGWFRVGSTMRRAHGVAYRMLVGVPPEGTELDHLCRVRRCVNPAHLDAVTHTENMRRATPYTKRGHDTMGAIHRAKTHCPQGHPYSVENTYRTSDGKRQCRTCKRTFGTASCRRRRDALRSHV